MTRRPPINWYRGCFRLTILISLIIAVGGTFIGADHVRNGAQGDISIQSIRSYASTHGKVLNEKDLEYWEAAALDKMSIEGLLLVKAVGVHNKSVRRYSAVAWIVVASLIPWAIFGLLVWIIRGFVGEGKNPDLSDSEVGA